MVQDIVFADRKYRNRVILTTLTTLLIFTFLIIFILPLIIDILQRMEPEKAMKTEATILFFLFLVPIPTGFKLLSLSNRILREERYPPEGMKLIHNQIIIRGDKAKLRAYVFMLMAFLIFFICIFCAFSAQIFLSVLITTGS
jgi:peptidoglycan biosynthesis protein MviN/MurJ (putative lipid II flippase)